MTTRRTVLKGASALIAPAQFELAKPPGLPQAAPSFSVLIEEYRRMLLQFDDLLKAHNRIEEDAIAREIKFRDCPELDVVERDESAWFLAEKKLIRRAARTPAPSIDEVMLKLILWRLTDFDPGGFDNAYDMLSFSAYRDLLSLTGRESLTRKADEKALEIVWDDRAFIYDDDDD